jgi:hypothetical protein
LAAVKRALAFTSDTEQEDNASNIQVFPNPGYDLVSFHFSGGNEGIEDVEIYDINGRKWFQEHYSDTHILRTIQINALPEGMYIYHIKSGKQWLKGKFVKI